MAEFVVASTIVGSQGQVAELMDDVTRYHQVGGLYITAGEREIIKEALGQTRDWLDLPHRIKEVAAFFVSFTTGRDRIATEETFNICRFSLGLPLKKMKEMWHSFYHGFREDNDPHPIMQFLHYLIKEAIVKEEQFIIDKCFTLPFCNEHDACKVLHCNVKGSGHLCCCDKKECKAFTNFNVRRAGQDPGSCVVRNVVMLT